ncbi:hypothetical protein JF737_24140 [Mycobacterium avium]|nr:hypothetical protein [Mycobacterium avium]MCA2260866.1 hypothetical protein [Mycobacterium avium]MCA2281514.1 hypothetical protein [Mycobacterium avium]MCA2286595.1 hypothetical protein [Mycobacterium avium]MCA2291205.1 hypothetical protein [Mycobacterium avium]MCA2301713.1 hypothetical protein [Mycobacterium avium]
MTTATRLYAPAYFGPEGDLRVIGQETAWLPGAIAEMTKLEQESESGDADLVVAYRDVPAWQRLPADAYQRPSPNKS